MPGVVRAPCPYLARWGLFGPHAPAWHGGRARWRLRITWQGGWGQRRRPTEPAPGLQGGSGGAVLSIGWGGGELAVGAADEPPAALMDGPMMGPADQGQVVQVGGATIQPMPHMMTLTPGQGTGTAGEDTAAVADGQGLALGGSDDSGGAAEVQGAAGGAAQDRGGGWPARPAAVPPGRRPWGPGGRGQGSGHTHPGAGG